ncbi:MAG: tetratricopeptide repeat protein, partial [Crocosphaera sp.]|nr:tetratricopeptide repeat protein [Crocosphaera sp.]
MRVHYLIKYLLSSVLVIGQSSLVLAENTCFVDDNLSATEQIEVEITELVEYTDKEVNALMQQGRHDESTTLLEKIATINSKKKDITESNVGYYLEEIAKIYQSQGNYVKAEELYLQNINYFRQAFTDALERIEKGSLEGNQQIQELLTQVDTLARNPDRLTMQIQRLSQAI